MRDRQVFLSITEIIDLMELGFGRRRTQPTRDDGFGNIEEFLFSPFHIPDNQEGDMLRGIIIGQFRKLLPEFFGNSDEESCRCGIPRDAAVPTGSLTAFLFPILWGVGPFVRLSQQLLCSLRVPPQSGACRINELFHCFGLRSRWLIFQTVWDSNIKPTVFDPNPRTPQFLLLLLRKCHDLLHGHIVMLTNEINPRI